MVSLRTHTKKTALAADDQFWHSPILMDDDANAAAMLLSSRAKAVGPNEEEEEEDAMGDCGGDGDGEHCCAPELPLPAAHHQLLSHEVASREDLKGYDHTTRDLVGGYGCDDLDSYEEEASNGYFCRQKLSAVKQQGGGSWLLGFARLNESPAAVSSPEEEEEEAMAMMPLPGLVASEDDLDSSSDDSSVSSTASSSTKSTSKRRGVSFNSSVSVQPVPHSMTLAPHQRRRMYTNSYEVRQNKIRNKREYRYDGYDWRNVTEEWEMGVDMVTGELIHPAHERQAGGI